MAGWAYTRAEPLPETAAELEGAKNRLIGAIEERDPEYRLESARRERGRRRARDRRAR